MLSGFSRDEVVAATRAKIESECGVRVQYSSDMS